MLSLKLDIESRPSQEDYDEKIQQCNALRTELTTLTEQLSSNEKLLHELRMEADEERARYREKSERCLSECSSQTEDEEDEISVIEIESTKSAVKKLMEASEDEKESVDDEINHQEEAATTSTTPMPQTNTLIGDDFDEDEKFNNHPKVLYEEELIIFKEKCKSLSEENVRLQQELSDLRTTFGHFHGNWLHNAALKYLVPIVIVFIAYIFLSLKS